MIPGTDSRLCVDSRPGDNSSVFHRDMLDEPEKFATAEKPWCFDHDHGPTEFYATEDEACAAQREYREARGFEPLSGNAKMATLDDAVGEFDMAPSDKVCAQLLRVATQYHQDGMIEDDTLRAYTERVAEWLADE